MAEKKKKEPKVKEPIKIRFKKLANGNKSIYLDCYIDGRREYEFLKLYLVPERTSAEKAANEETLRLANSIKAKKVVEMQNRSHGFSVGSGRSKMNLLDYVEHYATRKQEKAGGDKRSIGMLYRALRRHLKLYGGDKTTFKQVDKHFCIGFIEYLKTAKSRINGELLNENTQLGYMKKFETVLNAAISDEIITINPFKHIKPEVKPKKQTTKIEYLTIEDIKKLENTDYIVSRNVKNAFLFSCYTGLRFSDIKNLTWDKLQTDNGVMLLKFMQKKTKKWEYLPLSDRALQYLPLKGNAAGGDSIFNLPINCFVNVNLRNWVAMAGINKRVTFHVARHTNATLLLSLDVPIETVSKILGHSDIRTTQIYAKVMDKSKLEAVRRLDSLEA